MPNVSDPQPSPHADNDEVLRSDELPAHLGRDGHTGADPAPLTGLPYELRGRAPKAIEPAPGGAADYFTQTPLVGAIPFGGVVAEAQSISIANGATITVGEKGDNVPSGTVMILLGTNVEVLNDDQKDGQITAGYLLSSVRETVLPVRRVTLRATNTGALVQYLRIRYT